MPERVKFASHGRYIAAAPAEARKILRRVQTLVETAVPGAERCIGYNIPAYRAGKIFFYFAAFKNHLGVYPPVRGDAGLIRRLARYRNAKGNLAFKYAEPVPWDLIRRTAKALAREYGG
jgi:uncharacterized protein YdhG (YjbR/CyaY superfamily)